MNFKKRHNHKTIWRKELNPVISIKEWSRMLHKWWKIDVYEKTIFKKEKAESNFT